MGEDLVDYYDRCFDADANEDNPYKDDMYRDLEERACKNCGHKTLFRPGEGYCHSCAYRREKGMDL
jgi:hypothetical protein